MLPNTKLNTALAVLRLAGEQFQQHNLLSTATDAERRGALQRLLDWWNYRAWPFLKEVDQEQSLPFTIQTGYKVWSAMARRALSPEVDYGVNWGLHKRGGCPTWRVSFMVNTGEIFAVELANMDRFIVLGVVEPEREAAEAALAGWADSEMTLATFFDGRFNSPVVTDPVAEAAEELQKNGPALRRIALAWASSGGVDDDGRSFAAIGAILREIGLLAGEEVEA